MSQNSQIEEGFFLLAENYCKYRKNNKCNKIPNLERKEAKKDPEMSANIAKVTRIVHASWKHPWQT